MTETLYFIAGSLTGFILSIISFKAGSKNAHQAYDVIYTQPEGNVTGEEPNKDIQQTQKELYDWDSYETRMKYQQFEEEDDNLESTPN